MSFYYLGIKQSTIENNHFFKKAGVVSSQAKEDSITYKKIYGSEINYNDISQFKKISKFHDRCIKIFLKEDKNAKFMMYNQAGAMYMHKRKELVCVNNLKLIEKLNNKPISRELLKDEICLLDYKYIKGRDISFELLQKLYDRKIKTIVVQQPVGFGGVGTFKINKDNFQEIMPLLNKKLTYSVSEFIENTTPVNSTFMISDNDVFLFDCSCQIISNNNELVYAGWDFEGYKNLSQVSKNKVKAQTLKIAAKLQQLGYRGICGIDYIIKGKDVYFMEVNPRFQVSSQELDKKLIEKGFPSIFELNYLSFYNAEKFSKFARMAKN